MPGRTTRWGIAALGVAASLAITPASLAQEVGDPRDAVKAVTDAADQATGGATGGSTTVSEPRPVAPPAAPPQPAEDHDAGAHETSDPSGPDHASGSVADVDVAGDDAVDVGSTNAQVEEDGQATGDVTVLAIGGNEIVGAHSDSESGPESDSVAPFDALCEGSGGGVCVGLLFAETTSTESGGSSSAESEAALAFACLGGSDPDAGTDCDGVVGVGVGTSSSSVTQDGQTGDTSAQQETAVADACLGGEDEEGTCSGLGVEVLRAESQSEATSPDGPGTTSASSCTADIEAGGSGNCVIEDSEAIEIPPGCPAGQSLLCVYVNQGETFVFTGGAGSRQEALHVSALGGAIDGSDLITLHVADAETWATNSGPQVEPDTRRPEVGAVGRGPGAPVVAAGGGGPELAFTGTGLPWLALALAVLASLGATLVAAGRRRAKAAR